MKAITWTISDVVDILVERRNNEFDGNIAVSGDRGNGKSTLINKTFYRFKGFSSLPYFSAIVNTCKSEICDGYHIIIFIH